MAGKRYFWLKLKDDIFSSRRIKKLRRLENGDTLFVIYLKLQLRSIHNEGKLQYTGVEATMAEELALEIDEEPENVEACLTYLLKSKLAEQLDDNTIYLPWAVINTQSETEDAERVREYRKRKKEDAETGDTSPEQCTHNVQQSDDTIEQCTNNVREIKEKENREKKEDTLFDQLWTAYPKKSGDIRTACSEYMNAVRNGAKPEEILQAARELAATKTEEDLRYLPSLEKWLRNRAWIRPAETNPVLLKQEVMRRRAAETAAYLAEGG